MSLKPGSRLGNYEIMALIGAGGMGEVYRARDPKLNRLVAIKVLHQALADSSDLLARFDREAKAVAALSHPNVLGIFDLGSQDGVTYAVMELLEGENLRDKLKGGALPPRRAVEIAVELAQGLGAAHERGIVHRDVKPENIFITREGRVKVLDFGLARLTTPAKRGASVLETDAMGATPKETEAGRILGTVGYMSPEQVKGEVADHRADVFAFGVVLYEMLSGRRPFQGETAHHTLTAILDQEPPPMVATRGPLPPALERLVMHCLDKNPKARFQAMADLAYDLQSLGTLTPASGSRPPVKRRPPFLAAALGAGLVLCLGLGALLGAWRGWPFSPKGPPSFTRLSRLPGTIESARFGPDGKTVYFSERIKGGKPEIFVLSPDSPEPRALGIQDAVLQGVSTTGELAILHRTSSFNGSTSWGMLARVDGSGGAIRESQDLTVAAAWDGAGFATVTASEDGEVTLTFAGRQLLKLSPNAAMLRHLRVAPGGGCLALVEGGQAPNSELVTYDRAGTRTVRFTKQGDGTGETLTGLAWAPGGDLWFSEFQGDQTALWRLPLGGQPSLRWRGPGRYDLMDISPEGRVLMVQQRVQRGVLIQEAGAAQHRDVSMAYGTQAFGYATDGRSLLLTETPVLDGGTVEDRIFLQQAGAGPLLSLGKGSGGALSPDGRWVQMLWAGTDPGTLDPAVAEAFRAAGLEPKDALDPRGPASLLFLPTGAGHPWALAMPRTIEAVGYAYVHPDGRRVIFQGTEHGTFSYYWMDRKGGAPVRFSQPGYGIPAAGIVPLSPDGEAVIEARFGSRKDWVIQGLDGGRARPIPGLEGDRPIGWTADQKGLYVCTGTDKDCGVVRLDLATGTRRQVFSFSPGDPTGLVLVRSIFTPPDGSRFAISYLRVLSDLYLMEARN